MAGSFDPFQEEGLADDAENVAAEVSEDTDSQEDTEDVTTEDESTEETEDESTEDNEGEGEPTPAFDPSEISSLKQEAANNKQMNGQLLQVAQQLKQELDALKAQSAQPKTEAKPVELPQGFDQEKFDVLSQANDAYFKNQFGMSPAALKQRLEQLDQNTTAVLNETNSARSNEYLQKRVSDLQGEIGADRVKEISAEAGQLYFNEKGERIANMDPSQPWNYPPDIAMKVKLADKYLANERQTATDQSKARKAKVAKRASADSASTKRTGKSSGFAEIEGWETMSLEQAQDALLGG